MSGALVMAVLRLLVRLLPSGMRARHGAEMMEQYAWALERSSGWIARGGIAARAAWDIVRATPNAYAQERRRRRCRLTDR